MAGPEIDLPGARSAKKVTWRIAEFSCRGRMRREESDANVRPKERAAAVRGPFRL
jgi:hypothetical protein